MPAFGTALLDRADDGGIFAVTAGVHGVDNGLRLVGWRDAYHLALVGDLERIVSEHVAGTADGILDGYVVFRYHDIHAALLGELVQRRCKAAAGRISEAAYVGRSIQHACDQVVQGCGIAFERSGERKVLAPAHDRDAVVADGARHDDRIARLARGA